MQPEPRTGRMSWADAAAGPLAGTTCLWQDLDGLHTEPAPTDPPLTSHLWAWTPAGDLFRLRLDDGTAYIARHPAGDMEHTLPWPVDYGRIAAAADRLGDALHDRYVQVVDDGIAAGAGPITFIRPAG